MFFPTNADLADILGDTKFDFENLHFGPGPGPGPLDGLGPWEYGVPLGSKSASKRNKQYYYEKLL